MTYPRFCRSSIQEALQDTPITILTGARQTGKSTLVSTFSKSSPFTFDDWSTLQSAKSDPEGFIQGIIKNPWPIILDEVQHAPEIFLPLKKLVDQNRQSGMFLLTGSANLLNWEQLPDSLAGRVEYMTLYPLSLAEILEHKTSWIDELFNNGYVNVLNVVLLKKPGLSSVEKMIMRGGYPEAFRRDNPARREAWYSSYIKALIERDIRNLEAIENPLNLHQLMIHLALNVGSTLNFSNLALKLQISLPTVRKYVRLLELLCLCHELRPWHQNIGKRLIKTSKLYFNDTGFVQHLGNFNHTTHSGILTEHFIFNELQKQISWSQIKPQLYFWRTSNGREIDFILEDKKGQIVGIEVKASSSVSASDFSHLKALQQDIPNQFIAGYVVYKGEKLLPFGPNLYAVPITWLF
ncbi:MAG: ATP-binding protein [Alphaproteobacteria bacterium]|nr:ATP-binding protein [Alphaproteobacteria bacterium]